MVCCVAMWLIVLTSFAATCQLLEEDAESHKC